MTFRPNVPFAPSDGGIISFGKHSALRFYWYGSFPYVRYEMSSDFINDPTSSEMHLTSDEHRIYQFEVFQVNY